MSSRRHIVTGESRLDNTTFKKAWTLEMDLLKSDDEIVQDGLSIHRLLLPPKTKTKSNNRKRKKTDKAINRGMFKPASENSYTKLSQKPFHEEIYGIIERKNSEQDISGQEANSNITIDVIIEELLSNRIFQKKDDDVDTKNDCENISNDATQSSVPSLTNKQLRSVVGKNIREMIQEGSIVGISLGKKGIQHGYQKDYAYKVHPLYHKYDYESLPILCRSHKDMTPLRVFNNLNECASQLKLQADRVLKVCRGTQNKLKGLVFEWWSPNAEYKTSDSFNNNVFAMPVGEIVLNYIKSSPRSVSSLNGNSLDGSVIEDEDASNFGEEATSTDIVGPRGADRSSKRARKAPRLLGDEYTLLPRVAKGHTSSAPNNLKTSNNVSDNNHGIYLKGSYEMSSATCTVLICDGCDGEYFMEQLGLTEVPEGDWYCDNCTLQRERKRRKGQQQIDDDNEALRGGQSGASEKHSIIFLKSEHDDDSTDDHTGIDEFNDTSLDFVADVSGSYSPRRTISKDKGEVTLTNVSEADVFVAIQVLRMSEKDVTFRAICQHLHGHLFSSTAPNDDISHKQDERIVLAIIKSLESLMLSGRIIERVGGVRTPGALRRDIRSTKNKVAAPRLPNVRIWPPIVRFYDDDNNLDVTSGVRVPPEQRKTYEVNVNFHDTLDAIREGLRIHCLTFKGTLLRIFSTTTECSRFFNIKESVVLLCCNGVMSDVGGLIFKWKGASHDKHEFVPEIVIPSIDGNEDDVVLKRSYLHQMVLQIMEVLCRNDPNREVDIDEIYASLLTEFAGNKKFPIHIQEAMEALYKKGFVTVQLCSSRHDLNRHTRKYCLNPHHRSDLNNAAVLCSSKDDSPLFVFKNLAELSEHMKLRQESVLKVCLKTNTHGDTDGQCPSDEGRWPKSHANLKFKWANEMTPHEKAELKYYQSEINEKIGERKISLRDRVYLSLQDWFDSRSKESTASPGMSSRGSSREKTKQLNSYFSQFSDTEHDDVLSLEDQHSLLSSPHSSNVTTNSSIGVEDAPITVPGLRRSVSINSPLGIARDQSHEGIANENIKSMHVTSSGRENRSFLSSLLAYCTRHEITEESVTSTVIPDCVPLSNTSPTSTDDQVDDNFLTSEKERDGGAASSSHVRSRSRQKHAQKEDASHHIGKRRWKLTPDDLVRFADAPTPAAVLRTLDEGTTSNSTTSNSSDICETSTTAISFDMFVDWAKINLYDVGSIFKAKIYNKELEMNESRVVVVVSTSSSITLSSSFCTDPSAYRLTVFSGTLPLHTISLSDCPAEFEDTLWDYWCKHFLKEDNENVEIELNSSPATSENNQNEMEARDDISNTLRQCVSDIKSELQAQRWSGTEVERALPLLLKKPTRTVAFITTEPDLLRTLKVLRHGFTSDTWTKSMRDLIRLHYFISDDRSKSDMKDKDRKDRYRRILRVYLCADFLLSHSSKKTTLHNGQTYGEKRYPSKEDISEWLSLYSAYNFTDLFA